MMSKSNNTLVIVAMIFVIILAILAVLSNQQTQEKRKTIEPKQVVNIQKEKSKLLTRELLNTSLKIGGQNLISNQKPAGNFNYEYNFITNELSKDDNQVRQAGALWGLALIYNDDPTEEKEKALQKSLDFFIKNSKETVDGLMYVVYPGSVEGETGTTAITTLALVDYLRTGNDEEAKTKYKKYLDKYVQFLLSMFREDGHFYGTYSYENGKGLGKPSSYYDGESLLALTKACKYLGYKDLKNTILDSAEKLYKDNIEKALKEDPDSATTKGFYQWSSMAYYEIYTTKWKGVKKYGKRVLDLARWMIFTHKTLKKGKNTGYAYEGLIHAWVIAKDTKDKELMNEIQRTIDKGLFKLTTWQVGSPVENKFLQKHKTDNPLAVGGVMNGSEDPVLRIDVTQHQMHAVILARKYVYMH